MVILPLGLSLHNFLCLVTQCAFQTPGEESYNPFMVESVCLVIALYSLCECICGQFLPTDLGCVSVQEEQWAPAHFRRQ